MTNYAVYTTSGTLHSGPYLNPGSDGDTPAADELTQEQAEALCEKSNAQAGELGIATRYEVREA